MDVSSEPTPVSDAETTVKTAIDNTDFTLLDESFTDGILRFDIDCGGLPRVPDARDPVIKPDDSHQKTGERAQTLSEIIQAVKDCSEIIDFEVWLAAEAAFHDPSSSKFNQKPTFESEDKGLVVLLVQPFVQ